MVGSCEVRERNIQTRGSRANPYAVPPSAFTTFHLGMLTNADALKDDVKTSPCCGASFSLIGFTAKYGAVIQGILQCFIRAKSRPAGRFEFSDQEFKLGYIRRILQESPPPGLRYESLYRPIATQAFCCHAQGLVDSCRGFRCGIYQGTWGKGISTSHTWHPRYLLIVKRFV